MFPTPKLTRAIRMIKRINIAKGSIKGSLSDLSVVHFTRQKEMDTVLYFTYSTNSVALDKMCLIWRGFTEGFKF